ncbi:MAG: hypothetical protein FWC88_04645, partial [Endomicrobia bacterium]|nr:hypothetical protein [Endomicrobiia bacterium]
MKKCLFAVIFLTFFFVFAHADTDKISNVVIDGLKNVKLKNVISVIESKKGKYYTQEITREDVRSILELGYFDDVEVRFDKTTGKLTFIVSEKPYVEK